MSGRITYEKQKKRKEALKQLLDEGCVIGENAETADIISTMRNVQHILDQSNQLAMGDDEIDNTTEAVMDAQVLKMSHELIGSAVQNIDSAEFNDQHFVKDILAFLQGAGPAAAATTQDVQMRSTRGSANWIRLSDLAAPLCRSFRWSQCMLGTFEPDTSEVVVSQQTQRQQRAPRTRISEQVKPQHLAQLQAEEKPKQLLSDIMRSLKEHIHQNGGVAVPYYSIVVDPHSFMNTVDNCFQMSFLFQDGYLFLDVDAEEMPTVGLVLPTHTNDPEFKPLRQMVSSMSPPLWRAMIQRYDLKEPILKLNRDELLRSNQSQQSQSQNADRTNSQKRKSRSGQR